MSSRWRVVNNTVNNTVGETASDSGRGKPSRRREPVGVQSVLSQALRQYGLENDLARYRFVLHWREIVGEEIAKKTKPECLRNGSLVVRVATSAWAQELTFQKDIIISRLKKFLGNDEVVQDLFFYVGKLK